MGDKRRRAVKLFYCNGSFYVKNLHKEWMKITDGVAKHYLIRAGFKGGKSEFSLTEVDNHLLTIRERDTVTFAGPIAGMKAGLLVTNGERVLVTRSPNLPIAKKGSFLLWEQLLSEQFGQALPLVLEWHRQAYLRVASSGGTFLPALAVCGASGIGKSMLANILTRNLLGGRMGKPFRYMSGDSAFNSDICGSETLVLDDVPDRMKQEKLQLVRSELKRMLADPTESLHRKGYDAITVPVVRATVICINDEPHNLRFLPLSDSSMDDKLMLVRVLKRAEMLPQSNDFTGQRDLEKRLLAQLPALLWYLTKDFKCPKIMLWRRGEPCYRDQALMQIAHDDDAVTRLLYLFEGWQDRPTVALPAPEWEKALIAEKGNVASKLLDTMSLGHVLREAAKRFPQRVQKDETTSHGGMSKWKILDAPNKHEAD